MLCDFKGERKQNQKHVFALSETSTSKITQAFYLQQISANRPGNTARMVGVGSPTSFVRPGTAKSLLSSVLLGRCGREQEEGRHEEGK